MKAKITKSAITPVVSIRSSEQFGNAIRRFRKLQNLSQVELAKKAGVTQATVSKIENGSKSAEIETLILLFAALNLEITVSSRLGRNRDALEGLF